MTSFAVFRDLNNSKLIGGDCFFVWFFFSVVIIFNGAEGWNKLELLFLSTASVLFR